MLILRALAFFFGALALAGCAGATSSSGAAPQSSSADNGALLAPAQSTGLSSTSGSGSTTGPIAIGTPTGAGIERSVIAAYTVPPGSFLDSFEGVITRGVGVGGYVDSSSTQPDSSNRTSAAK
jgi:hypothetical protein